MVFEHRPGGESHAEDESAQLSDTVAAAQPVEATDWSAQTGEAAGIEAEAEPEIQS